MQDGKFHKEKRGEIYDYIESQFGKLTGEQHSKIRAMLKDYVSEHIAGIQKLNKEFATVIQQKNDYIAKVLGRKKSKKHQEIVRAISK